MSGLYRAAHIFCSSAIAGLSYCRREGDGRGPTPQFGQIGYGGIEAFVLRLDPMNDVTAIVAVNKRGNQPADQRYTQDNEPA